MIHKSVRGVFDGSVTTCEFSTIDPKNVVISMRRDKIIQNESTFIYICFSIISVAWISIIYSAFAQVAIDLWHSHWENFPTFLMKFFLHLVFLILNENDIIFVFEEN